MDNKSIFIGVSNMSFFEDRKREGDEAQRIVVDYLSTLGYRWRKSIDKVEPFDYLITRPNGTTFTAEIKKYGKPEYGTIFAETVQISPTKKLESTPEYLAHTDKIDAMIYVDVEKGRAFIYHMKKFASYVKANMDKQITIARGTAKGIKISECCQDAGFKTIINLKGEN